jgi:antitoxin (DNA-binding transcriptional repressor) of toxin-antitoxin stability system
MATIVSSTDFRTRLGAMFDLADKGEQIFIKRRHKPSYSLTPVDIAENVDDGDDDDFFTPEMLAEIDAAMEEAKQGKGITLHGKEEITNYFESRYGI